MARPGQVWIFAEWLAESFNLSTVVDFSSFDTAEERAARASANVIMMNRPIAVINGVGLSIPRTELCNRVFIFLSPIYS